jgi:hypothetical protein
VIFQSRCVFSPDFEWVSQGADFEQDAQSHEPRTSAVSHLETPERSRTAPIRGYIDRTIRKLIATLPNPKNSPRTTDAESLPATTAVLEGNFIYWMTAAYLAVASEEARSIIQDNLREEVRDNHPGMLRKFAMAARAVPTDSDALAVHRNLQNVRRFVARLSGAQIVLMMTFFEAFITRFMPYFADLATRRARRSRNTRTCTASSISSIRKSSSARSKRR